MIALDEWLVDNERYALTGWASECGTKWTGRALICQFNTLTKVNSTPSRLTPVAFWKRTLTVCTTPLLCFLYTSSAEVFVSFPRETVGHFQREWRWIDGATGEEIVKSFNRLVKKQCLPAWSWSWEPQVLWDQTSGHNGVDTVKGGAGGGFLEQT